MVKRKFKLNIFDICVVVAIIICSIFVIAGYKNRPYLGSRTLEIIVKISNKDTIDTILPQVKQLKDVNFSGTKYLVKQVSYDINESDNVLYIKLRGPGDIKSDKSIFNGQKIYLNQKVEIRADYAAQGYITDFYYVD